LGVETVPGVLVAANRRLNATTIAPSIQANVTTFKPQGGLFTTIAALGKEWTEAAISGPLTYTDSLYLLAGVLNYAAPVQQAATAAYLWTFTPPQTGGSTVKTYTVEVGTAAYAHLMKYGMVNSLAISIDRDNVDVSGTMIGQALSDNVTMTTAGLTDIAMVPVLPTQFSVYIDPAGASLGTTKMTRVLRASIEIGDRFNPIWPVDAAANAFPAHIEATPTATVKLLMEADAAGMALLTAMRAGTKKFIRMEAIGALIASTYYYTYRIDSCGVVSSVSPFSDEDGVYAIEWTFDVAYDAAWAKALTVAVTSTVVSL
jgi:hypothetical protein